MSEYKSVNLTPIIGKLSLFTSIFCLTMPGIAEASPTISRSISQQYLAQREAEPTTREKPRSGEPTKPPSVTNNALEKKIIAELNRVRTDPQGYADWLESQKQYYQGILVKLPGEQPIRMNRGLRRLDEAIAFLRQQEQLPALSSSNQLTSTAKQRITSITNNQTVKERNNLVYGRVTPEAIVMQLVVDDGFPDRRNRLAIFNQNHSNAGIVCREIPLYRNVCAIAYQVETAEVAQNTTPTNDARNNNTEINSTPTETKPETSITHNSDRTPNNNQLPKPPDINTPITSESVTTATIANANNEPRTPGTTSTNQPESEVIVSTETPKSTANTTETQSKPEVTNNPVTPTEPNVETPKSTETTTATEETTENNQTTSNTATETQTESEVIVSTEMPSESNTEVATTSPTNNTFEAIKIVEEGKLEEGDEIIPNDGSFYDSYPLDGSAGDSFTITLESPDFDTFLAIMDGEGNIIEQNDDVNEQESNSRLEITLPDNGTYSVIVNSYEEGGKGKYTLTVTP